MTASIWLTGPDGAWVERLGWTLLHSLWQGAAAAVLLALALRAMRSASPQGRYLAACAALLLAAAAPAATFFAVKPAARPSAGAAGVDVPTAVAAPVFPARAGGGSIESPIVLVDIPSPSAQEPEASEAPSAPGAETSPSWSVSAAARPDWAASLRSAFPAAVAAWLAGVALMSLRLAGSCVRVRRLRTRGAAPAAGPLADALDRLRGRLGVSRPVALLESALVEVPTVFGWLRPVILLPATAVTGMPASQVAAILAHELAHVRRGDYSVNLLQNVAEAVLFYHPAVWWLSARVRAEREHCCDDLAVAACGDRRGYAAALLRLEELRPAPAVALAAGGGDLLGRVRRLAGRPERDRLPAWWPAGLIAAAVAAAPLVTLRAEADPAAAAEIGAETKGAAPKTAKDDAVVRHDLTGTVADPDGVPVAGANVFIYSAGVRTGTATLCPSCYPDCAKRATTDAEGRFSIPSLDPELLFKVLVAADGHEPAFTEKVDPAAESLAVTVEPRPAGGLDPKLTIRGRVVDHEGKPVLGAVLSPRGVRTGTRTRFGGNPIDAVAVTDADGEFLIAGGEPFDAAALLVEARGFANEVSPELAAGSTDGTIELGPGCVVTGRLLRDGSPVAGAKVGIVQEDRSAATFLGPKEIGTDEDGVFLFDNVGPDEAYQVYALVDGVPGGGVTRVERVVTGLDGEAADVGTLEVMPAATVAGRVVLSDGKPVPPGVRIGLYRDGAWDSSRAEVDAEGRFSLRGVPGEAVSLGLRVPGYHLSTRNASYLPLRMNLTGLVAVPRDDLIVLLDPGDPSFEGINDREFRNRGFSRERWLKERPLEGAPADWKDRPAPDPTELPDGVDRTHDDPARKKAATNPGPAPAAPPADAPAGRPTQPAAGAVPPLEATPPQATGTVTVEGTVRGEAERPIEGATVRVLRYHGGAEGEELRRAETGPDGRFRFPDLPATPADEEAVTYLAAVTKPGLSSAIRVMASGRPRPLDVALLPPAILRGRVLDERDNGVEGAVVHRHAIGDGPIPGVWTAVSGEQGYYEITDLPPWRAAEGAVEPGLGFPSGGKHSRMVFNVRKPGYARGQGLYGELPATVDVSLERAAVIEGRVIDAVTGKPAAGAGVVAQGYETLAGGATRTLPGTRAVADAEGRYRLDSLEAGTFNVWAKAADRVVAPLSELVATAGETTQAPDLRLTEGGFVSGRVIDVDTGEPASRFANGNRFRVAATAGNVRGSIILDSVPVQDDGTFRVRAAPGRSGVYVMIEQDNSDRSLRHRASVEVTEGESVALPSFRIRLPKPKADP